MAFLNILLVVALIAITGVLLFGVVSMAKGGDFNRKHGNALMRWRVILQAVALGIILLIYLANRG